MKEGVIKYRSEWDQRPIDPFPAFDELNATRELLWKRGLIGVYPNGIGFGNISSRFRRTSQFHISGSATGPLPLLERRHYAKVLDYSIPGNWVRCEGELEASSESLTHAAIYECDAANSAVIHVHHRALWERLLGQVPTTAAAVEYGTPAMAFEIGRLFRESDLPAVRVIAMAGHEEGVITFGESMADALSPLLARLS